MQFNHSLLYMVWRLESTNMTDGYNTGTESVDSAWEEYMSTGIDPTGGELGPDYDPETGEPIEDEINGRD